MTRRTGALGAPAADDLSDDDFDMLAPTRVPGTSTSHTSTTSSKSAAASSSAAAAPAPAKKKPGRPRAGSTTAKTSAAKSNTRVKEIPDTQPTQASQAQQQDGHESASDDLGAMQAAGKRGPRGGAKKSADKKSARGKSDAESEGEAQASSSLSRSKGAASKKAPKPAKKAVVVQEPEPEPEPEVPETQTQADDMDVDGPAEEAQPEKPVQAKPRAQKASKKRAGSPVAVERDGDPATRRKLDEMTKRFETLQTRYQDLEEVGVKEAGRNFDALQKQSEERSKVADKLIAKLRADTATASAKAADIDSLQAELAALRESHIAAEAESKKLQASLQASQNDNKALQAKLAATRSGSEMTNGRTVPGSAAKNGRQPANTDAQKELAKRALIEDLYADLTGMIINNVKRREESGEDVYDCIQTGRNGTLQFLLSIPNPAPEGEAYDDVEIGYEPMLDEKRDAAIIAVLPEFAREEICFQRAQAAKFYAQIREAMQRRVDVDEGEDGGMDV